MKQLLWLFAAVSLLIGCATDAHQNTLKIHPENPHYFLFNNRPTILIGSTEHYGAVLNSEFDYIKYLDEVRRSGQNLTRTFSGVYCEDPTAFGITRNTLAPAPGKLLTPWARSGQPGYYNGGNKFDLNRWDEVYFTRLKSFIAEAGKRGIIVEYVLFCTYYDDSMWNLSPLNAVNNINGIGAVPRQEVLTLEHADLTRVQEAFVRKVVRELDEFDNLYYEICNEPYFGVSDEFQRFVAKTIRETEANLPKKHLIAQNIANNYAEIIDPDPNVDIFNFHYAVSAAVDLNYHLNKPLGDDETGFAGTDDAAYRQEAWNFLVSGGALFDHLDYSYAVGHEDGSFEFPSTQPGGGGRTLRGQLKIMRDFIESFDFIKMAPMQDRLAGVPDGLNGRLLGQEGEAYIGYLYKKGEQSQNISLRWSGKLVPEVGGETVFYTLTDDGVRLWVDGKLLIDDWTDHAPLENSGRIRLQAGKAVDFVMEYYQGIGGAAASIRWSTGGEKTLIPDRCFRQADGTPGLKVEYFDDTDLKRLMQRTLVANIFFSGDLKQLFPQVSRSVTAELQVELPAGVYDVQWLNTLTGEIGTSERVNHRGGKFTLQPPVFEQDVAFGVRRVK